MSTTEGDASSPARFRRSGGAAAAYAGEAGAAEARTASAASTAPARRGWREDRLVTMLPPACARAAVPVNGTIGLGELDQAPVVDGADALVGDLVDRLHRHGEAAAALRQVVQEVRGLRGPVPAL